MNSIETMLNTFILPLQSVADAEQRVHCSLNLNTETGRLSSRSPNLQNQPALEKDVYFIRKAFMAKPGNILLVSDYGQLELRVLAHMTKCKAMIEAFRLGGDFHSRTALSMYDYIKEDIAKGTCLLEWDSSKGEPPAPLLKHKYASERRQAKILNFSLAYEWKQRVFVDMERRRTDCRRISACRWRRRRKCLRSGTKSVRK